MKLIKFLPILAFSLLCIPYAHAMESGGIAEDHVTQLTDFPEEILMEIIEYGINGSLQETFEFRLNLALTNRQFAALTRDKTVKNMLAEKIKYPQEKLFEFVLQERAKISEDSAKMIINILIKAGAKLDERLRNWTPLMIAIFNDNETIVKALQQAGDDINKLTPTVYGWNWTILMEVSGLQNNVATKLIEKLLQAGADPFITNNQGKTALDFAHNPVVKNMLQEAMDRRVQNNNNNQN